MKIIITENQNKKLSLFKRSKDIMDESLRIINIYDVLHWGINFCLHYPTLKHFVTSLVYDITQEYKHNNFDTVNFINEYIGYDEFIESLMEEHGEKIREFYNERTKDC